jgi:hypothetical protein
MFMQDDGINRAPVANTCNPNYLGGRDQEARGSKPAGQIVLQDSILKKNLSHKKDWWSGSEKDGINSRRKVKFTAH